MENGDIIFDPAGSSILYIMEKGYFFAAISY
jgi:hypothetical protein